MRKTRSPILEAVHETAKGLHAVGVMEQVTLRDFDHRCMPPNLRCRWSSIDTESIQGEKSAASDTYR